jgi:hypothetical protein
LFLAGCCGVLWEEEEEVLLCIHIVSKALKFCWARVWRFGGPAFCRSSCFVWQIHLLRTSSSSLLPGYFWTDCYETVVYSSCELSSNFFLAWGWLLHQLVVLGKLF